MNRLKELRKDRNLTIQQVADAIGVGRNTISRYENEKHQPRPESWKRLADYFGVSVDYLKGTDPYKIYIYYNVYGNRTFLAVAKSKKQANKMLLNELRFDNYYDLSDFEVTTYPVNEAMIEEL